MNMYKKICNRCNRNSFSSTEIGEWLCPSCGYDLTGSPFYGLSLYEPLKKKQISREKVIQAYKIGKKL
jgi:ribosomal protein L37AE/L43A